MSGDVLEKAPAQGWAEFSDDPFDVGPQVPFVVFAFALSGRAEWLAWVSCKHGVDCTGEGLGVEDGDVIPDGRWGEVSGALSGDKGVARVLFPFDKATGVEHWFGKHEAHIKATAS
jgi:hypothetical protein